MIIHTHNFRVYPRRSASIHIVKRTAIVFLSLVLLSGSAVRAASLSDAHKDYLYGDYEAAISKANRLRENDQTLYFLGLIHMKMADYSQARTHFRRLMRIYPQSKHYDAGLVKLADTYFLEENFIYAKSRYEEIKRKYSGFNYQPLVYLRLAQIASKQGDWKSKDEYIRKIKKKYPLSPEAEFAAQLAEHKNFFTVQVGAFTNGKNAQTLKEELSKKYAVYIKEDIKGRSIFYKVRVGMFKERSQAERVYRKLFNAGYPARIYP